MGKLIPIILFLGAQFVMTPARKEAMDKAAIEIRTTQGKIDSINTEKTNLDTIIIKLKEEKNTKIAAAKTKLGLDDTWNWDDKTNTFVQAKKY